MTTFSSVTKGCGHGRFVFDFKKGMDLKMQPISRERGEMLNSKSPPEFLWTVTRGTELEASLHFVFYLKGIGPTKPKSFEGPGAWLRMRKSFKAPHSPDRNRSFV